MIDELPLLACVATRAEGETEIRGAGELRVKESDRIARSSQNLRAVGADAEELPDGFACAGRAEPLRRRGRDARRPPARDGVRRARRASPGNDIAIDDRDVRRGVVSRVLGRTSRRVTA